MPARITRLRDHASATSATSATGITSKAVKACTSRIGETAISAPIQIRRRSVGIVAHTAISQNSDSSSAETLKKVTTSSCRGSGVRSTRACQPWVALAARYSKPPISTGSSRYRLVAVC